MIWWVFVNSRSPGFFPNMSLMTSQRNLGRPEAGCLAITKYSTCRGSQLTCHVYSVYQASVSEPHTRVLTAEFSRWQLNLLMVVVHRSRISHAARVLEATCRLLSSRRCLRARPKGLGDEFGRHFLKRKGALIHYP